MKLISWLRFPENEKRQYQKYKDQLRSDEDQEKDALKGLKSAEGFLRRELARQLNLRNTPELTFVADHSISYGNHMSSVIDRVAKEDAERRKSRGETDDDV